MAKTQGNYDEPATPYGKDNGEDVPLQPDTGNSVYPFNQVYESESGHVIEVDDTPGAERINIHHRTGTFREMHPNGDMVDKVARDRYTSVLRDDYLHVDGFANITIDKAMKIVVNNDKLKNGKNSNVNFDIEIGENANVNLVINKGNCNVRLKDGDANLLLNSGDVNIKQEDGNFNHFVNGDYNLEVTGHMHTVIGDDQVTEIGGSRDCRIDGDFDNLHILTGYSETLIELGEMRIEVGGDKSELLHQDSYLQVIANRTTFIGANEEKTVTGNSKTHVSQNYHLFTDVNMYTSVGGEYDLRVGAAAKVQSTGNFSISSTANLNLFSTGSMNILATGNQKITSMAGLDLLSSSFMKISSGAVMGISAGGSLLQTASVIHLNGPSAPRASGAQRGQFPTNASLPTKPFVYVPGSPGVWKKTINGKTPGAILSGAVSKLQGLGTGVAGYQQELGASRDQLGNFSSQVSAIDPTSSTIASDLSSATSSASDLTSGISGIASGISGSIDSVGSVMGGVVDSLGSSFSGLTEGLSGMSSGGGILDGLKSGIGGIVGFVGDIYSVISDIACGIADAIAGILDAIGGIVDAVASTIASALGAVADAIGAIIDGIASVMDSIAGVIADVIGKITDIIASVFDAAGNFIGDIVDSIAGLLDGLGGRGKNCGISLGICTPDFSLGLTL